MKNILVPIDLSDVSEYALEVAVAIAQKHDATVILLKRLIFPTLEYTMIDNDFYEDKEDYYRYLTQESKDRLKDMIDRPTCRNVEFRLKVVRPEESLADSVAKQKVDLVVMGSTGASGWKEWTKGSNAEHVVRKTSCPVLVVKSPISEFQNVVFAVDFENEEFFKTSSTLLDTAKIKPHFVYVDNGTKLFDADVLRERVGKWVFELGYSFYHFEIIEADSIEKAILKYAEKADADIIVMYTHGRKGFQHFIYGSIAEDVVNHAKMAVMVSH
ncbi:universal stress protein [Runella sp.]|uniref:universal stress protein n=1 Tax=Runella sp. TaxID=1960881 RepID=UPI003D0F8881